MCTRIVYETQTGQFITGRGMDWNDPTSRFDIFVLPRGLEQVGSHLDNPLTWTSKYASIFTGMYQSISSDGVNEKGLTANVLYFAEADYGDYTKSNKPKLSIGAWNQYFLDNFATVKEAVEAMQGDLPFSLVAPLMANGRPASGHMSLSDESGDSAILEYINGELMIHHGADFTVMTNSPTYDEQIAITNYWKLIGGNRSLPGTINAADRFVRTSYFLDSTPKFPSGKEAVAAAMSIMRSIGVPLGMADPDHPNISATLWRTLTDHTNKRYYFESASQPSLFWVDFEGLDIQEGAPILSAQVNGPVELFGNINDKLQPADMITWM